MTTGPGDYYPTPVGYDSEAAYLEPTLAGSHKGRSAYLFRTLGGRGPLAGQRGRLVSGQDEIEAVLASAPGPLSLFIVDGEMPPGTAMARFRPEPAGSRPARFPNAFPNPFLGPIQARPHAELLPGGESFLDPMRGWLMALSEALPGGPEKWPADLWPPYDPGAPLPAGVTFVWALAGQMGEVALSLAQRLSGEGQTLVVSGSDAILEALATGSLDGAISLTPRPSPLKGLDAVSIESRLDGIKLERKIEAERIRAESLDHQKSEKLVAERLECWTRLEGLTRSLNHLRNEARQREAEWTSKEIDLIDSQRDFDKAERGQGGLMGLLGRKGPKGRLERAKANLDAAERSMRRVRLEMESLLGEARTVESELSAARDMVRLLPEKETLAAELDALRAIGQALNSQAASLELPVQDAQMEAAALASSRLIMTRSGDELPLPSVDNLIIASPSVTDPKSREALTAFVPMARKRLVVLADFTSWSWAGQAPAGESGEPAWRGLMAAASSGGPLPGPASFLGPLPSLESPSWLRPDPAKHGFLVKMGLATGLARLPLNHPTGPALRAFGDIGPFCPASALASVRLAVEATRKAKSGGDEANVYIMTASRAQAALARSLLDDFGRPPGIMAGEPQDFELWPPAAMVILDTALAPPQGANSLTSPELGRPSILRALGLAEGALVVCGSPAAIEGLPPRSPLPKLWSALSDVAWPGWLPLQPAPFWEALDQAKNEAFMVLPPFTRDWWPPLASHFLSALRRKVKMTIIAEMPEEEARDYPGQVIRNLRLNGANVVISEGFSDLLTLIDGRHFSLGAPGAQAARGRWPFLLSLELPSTVPLLMDLFQTETLKAKLGPGGLHGCPLCGWPHLLVNQGRPRDFDYRQGLRLGCLNPSCANHKRPRRLDERWPFASLPVCPADKMTPYALKPSGRTQNWVCPKHGADCPTYRYVPGDCPTYRP